MFPPHALLAAAHLFRDRAGERSILWAHAQGCARSGIETVHDAEGIHHDYALPEDSTQTLRIVTNHTKRAAITGYYLDTATAVQQREEHRSRAAAAREAEAARKTAGLEKAHHTAQSKHTQKEKQMLRGHNAGEHERKPNKACPMC